jgi:hypothetical protein
MLLPAAACCLHAWLWLCVACLGLLAGPRPNTAAMAPLHPYRSVARLAHCLECTLLRPAVPLSHRPTSHNPLPSRNCRLTHTAATPSFWRCDTDDAARFRDDGFIVARGLLSAEENELVRSALEGDKTLTENEIVLNDDAKGQTKLALWSNPGDGTLGGAR